jgi:hypothetical protein
MATKSAAAAKTVVKPAKAAPQNGAETPEKEGAESPDTPLPLLDLSDAAVKKMISRQEDDQAGQEARLCHL